MAGTATIAWVNPKGPFNFKRSITIDKTKVPSTQTDFTVLVSGTYTYLKTAANGGDVQSSSGYDIVFYSDSALTTTLKFERAFWDATTGDCEFWVKIPSLSSASDTVIYLAYGNSAISTDQSDAVNTWDSNFKAVYHYSNGTTLSATDSIGVNNGTINGNTTAVAGKIDGAALFDGADDYIDNGSGLTSTTFTYSAWVYPTAAALGTIFGNSQDAGGPHIYFNGGGSNEIIFAQQNTSTVGSTGINALTLNVWNYVSVSYDGTNYSIFYNNGNVSASSNAKTLSFGGNRWVGAAFTSIIFEWTGRIDEVHYSDTIRSTDWRQTEYNNQNSPSTFYSISAPL